ncbi:MAG: hypothetical protein PUB01_02460 [Desulfovibrionaceae bacterium]|nr:hypothetical protein [Desulfovibrionaceae bacterium]
MEKRVDAFAAGLLPGTLRRGFDPELLFVECGQCGAPVIWEPGQATQVLESAGVDPLELDASCLLISEGCPLCGKADRQFTVQVCRVESPGGRHRGGPQSGHA